MANQPRIGIYSGTFDPVHAGHISFALQAMEAAQLDRIYFLPERRPRNKPGVEHFGHRVAMLRQALRPHRKLEVLELEDTSFSVKHTLPRLRERFPNSRLVFLIGSDVLPQLPEWPNAARLLKSCELVVGARSQQQKLPIQRVIANWPTQPLALTIVKSYAAEVSSGKVRAALRERRHIGGLLTSVMRYSEHNWLYVSLAKVKQKIQ